MTDLSSVSQSVELVSPNFALAYSALARRVSVAYAYLQYDDDQTWLRIRHELHQAMLVIKQVETTSVILLPND